MRRRPVLLFFCALLFLYFPAEFFWKVYRGEKLVVFGLILSVVLPLVLMVGLIRVTKAGWYTLVTLCALLGMQDLYHFYSRHTSNLSPLLIHLGIYLASLAYFINPRVRTLYFDPKLRWWRTKPRYETHLPFLMQVKDEWQYPVLRNISEGGCFIETPHPLEVNSRLKVAIPLPVPLNLSVIKAEGEVRWVSTNPLKHGMGVQFDKPRGQTAKALKQFVAREL